MQKTRFLIFLACLTPCLAWGDCPARRGEDQTTFSQVMYHFGRATRVAGTLALKGLSSPESVSQDQILELEGLAKIAADCAQLALDPNANSILWPRTARRFQGQEQEAYLSRLRRVLGQFRGLLLKLEKHSCEMHLRDWQDEDFIRLQAI